MSDARPNFLVFMPDGFQGHIVMSPESITPNIDSVARRGTVLENCHCALPTCSPSRASIMTGMYPHNHGVLQVEHVVAPDQSVLRERYPHWATILRQTGYDTGYFGKWHIERSEELDRFGWSVNGCDPVSAHRAIGTGDEDIGTLLANAEPVRYYRGPEGYNDFLSYAVTPVETDDRLFTRITSDALSFIDKASRSDSPFACMVSYSEPNTPLIAGRSAYELYDPESIELPPNASDDLASAPGLYRRGRQVFSDIDDREWRKLRACYMALITELDSQLGRLLSSLEQNGVLDNTVVIITGDHGRYVGAHGLDAHNFGVYEEIFTVPFVCAGPGISSGGTVSRHVSLVDLHPTILDMAAVDPGDKSPVDGISFAPLLSRGRGDTVDDRPVLGENFGTRFLVTQRVLWHGRYKLVFNGFDFDELYDLQNDPYELENLADSQEHREIHERLMGELWHELERTNDRTLLETHYPPMRLAVRGPVGTGGKQ